MATLLVRVRVGGMSVRTWPILLVWFGLSWLTGSWCALWGQGLAAPSADAPAASAVEEVKPDGFYLKNKQGELVYVPDFPYEQFERLVQVERNLANPQRPAYVITSMAATGSVVGDRVELAVQYSIQRRESDGGSGGEWIRVPLRYGGAYLVSAPTFGGPGRHFLTFSEGLDGYVCWIQSEPETEHTVSLPLWIPLELVGDESRFGMATPAALVSSFLLRVSEASAEGTIRGATEEVGRPLTFESLAGGGQFTARALRGDVLVSWRKSSPAVGAVATRLDVTGAVMVTADERLQEVRSDGRFVVRSFGGPIESLRVLLPPGMRYRETTEPGYDAVVLPPEAGAPESRQIVEIRLKRAAQPEAHVRLVAELPPAQSAAGNAVTVERLMAESLAFEPARYEFLGAVRHRGYVDFAVNGDWSLKWAEQTDFPRVEPGQPPSTDGNVTARFRYYSQPCSLAASIRQEATRISVAPTYDVYVDTQQARLVAELACKMSGSRAGPLALRLPGWSVEVLNFVNVDNRLPIDLSNSTPLIVPIPPEAQSAGRFTLRIESRQDLPNGVLAGSEPLTLSFPMIEAANPSLANLLIAPANISVYPAGNVTLVPQLGRMKMLSPLVIPSATVASADSDAGSTGPASGVGAAGGTVPVVGTVPASGTGVGPNATALRYRDRGAGQQAAFVADFKIQPQAVSVVVASTATLDQRALNIEQRLTYSVLHEAVSTLTLDVPAPLVEGDRVDLRILLGDRPLMPTLVGVSDRGRAVVRVRLPEPTFGPIDVRVVHPRRELTGMGAHVFTVPIPLAAPSLASESNTTIVDNSLKVVCSDPLLTVAPTDGPWVVDGRESERGVLLLTTTSHEADAVVNASLSEWSVAGSSVVRRAWIQSWIAGVRRRDRVAMQIRAHESQLRVLLPRGANADLATVRAAVDHREVAVSRGLSERAIVIPLAEEPTENSRDHVIELWYLFEDRPAGSGWIALEPAMVDASHLSERFYWQLVMPADEMLLWGDRQASAEASWRWRGLGWQRSALLEQADLEQWVGASRQEPVPSATNRYLFTTLGMSYRLEVLAAPRGLVLLGASGLALAVGLLMLYFPALRHPAILLVAGVITLGVGLVHPEHAVVFAQAACLGALLLVAARVLRGVLWRAVPGVAAGPGRSPIPDSRVVEVRAVRTEGSSGVMTTAAPGVDHVPAAEARP